MEVLELCYIIFILTEPAVAFMVTGKRERVNGLTAEPLFNESFEPMLLVCRNPSGQADSISVGEKFFKQGDGWCVPNAFHNALVSYTGPISLPLRLWSDIMISTRDFSLVVHSSTGFYLERVKCDISKCHRWNSVSQGERY